MIEAEDARAGDERREACRERRRNIFFKSRFRTTSIMQSSTTLLALALLALASSAPLRRSANTDDVQPVHDLVARLGFPPALASTFTFVLEPGMASAGKACSDLAGFDALKECVGITALGTPSLGTTALGTTALGTTALGTTTGGVTITASSVPSLTFGLGVYLRRACLASLTWVKTGGLNARCTDAATLPPMPAAAPQYYARVFRWTYYQNVVDSSYSFAWFSEARWQIEVTERREVCVVRAVV